MTLARPRFEPLPPERFPIGEGPFRVRGLAYVTGLKYVARRLPGGHDAFVRALGASDPYAPYLEQIFVVSGDYDVSPLARLYVVAAGIEGVDVGRFIEERARRSAVDDTSGMWKLLLRASTPVEMAGRLHLAFNRYFQPCEAQPVSVRPGRFEGVLVRLPAPMSLMHVRATVGFVASALEVAGGRGIRVDTELASTDGELRGVPLERVRFVATWH